MIGCMRGSNNGPMSLERGMMHAKSSLDLGPHGVLLHAYLKIADRINIVSVRCQARLSASRCSLLAYAHMFAARV